ncbi:unnamed protein product [Chrysoparadoxa australica]
MQLWAYSRMMSRRGCLRLQGGKASCPCLYSCRAYTTYTLGSGWMGGLGLGDFEDVDKAVPIPTLEAVNMRTIVAGWAHTVGIDDNGHVLIWGRPFDFKTLLRLERWRNIPFITRISSWVNSREGDGVQMLMPEPQRVLLGQSETERAVSVAASAALTAVVSDTGAVYCLGSNNYGQCGIGSEYPYTTYELKEPVVGAIQGQKAIQAGVGLQHVIALSETGDVFVWGKGQRGQLGNGADGDSSAALQVSLPESAVQVSAGFNHCAALSKSGKLYIWGKMMSPRVLKELHKTKLHRDQYLPLLVECGPSKVPGVELCCSNGNTAVRLADGTVWVHGFTSDTKEIVHQPMKAEGLKAKRLLRGFKHVYAETDNGGIVVLDLCSDKIYMEPIELAGMEDRLEDVASVAKGWRHTVVLLKP